MLQAILFDVTMWTPYKAEQWLKKHNYKPIKSVHTTRGYHRYRMAEPMKGMGRFKTLTISKGIKFVNQ